jgi:hypothetical protein
MKNNRIVINSLCLVTLFGAMFLWSAKAQEDASKPDVKAKALAPIYTAAETKEFKALAKATLDALAAGKQTEVVAKLTDLETAWDDQEKVLRPKDEATWTSLDKTLDKAISALRSSHVNLDKGKAALESLLKKLDQATKP